MIFAAMNHSSLAALRCACTVFLACLVGTTSLAAPGAESDWSKVATALGRSGAEMPGGVYRIGLPRTDLHVTLDGVTLKPALALGSWLAFKHEGNATMVMGDLVLTETEIEPVMLKLVEGGIAITALHNHLLRAQPATFYMHVLGQGDPVKLATVLHDGLALSKTPLVNAPPAAAAPARRQIDLDTAMLDRILGTKGHVAGGVYQASIRRADIVRDGGMEVPVTMGSGEAMNFQPTGHGRAAITGDFVLTSAEVNPVLRTLRQNGIEITALHNHMLNDEPRLFFMHFWANDDAQRLAESLREALDEINVARN